MNFRLPLMALMTVTLATTARVDGGNDTFSQRKILSSQESTEEEISWTAELSFDAHDPVPVGDEPDASVRNGTLWWEWTAPRDGWFTAGTLTTDGTRAATFVFTGNQFEKLVPVHNGNALGVNHLNETIFEARQGNVYHIVVRIMNMPAEAPPGNPAAGVLRMRASPPPPVNPTLATRRVLPSTVPFTLNSTNLSAPSDEDQLFYQMMPLPGYSGQSYPAGVTQWWEWTCPETGEYAVLLSGLFNPGVSVAARKMLADGSTAPAGKWDSGGPVTKANRFQALAGRVYDLAVVSDFTWGFSGGVGYSDYTLGMAKVLPVAPAPNTTRATASAMPATLPSEVTLDWPGQTKDDLEPVRLWWKFTAPVRGIYSITASVANFQVHYEPGRLWIGSKVPLLRAGETVLIEHVFHRPAPRQITTRVELVGVPGNNNLIAQATDLGPATDFYLYGDGSQATLEAGESSPIFLPAPGSQPGTLWWRWTAPENGWLRIRSTRFAVPLEVFPGANPGGPHGALNNPFSVQAGTQYLIRAGFENDVIADVCAIRVDLLPQATNLTWQTARDLGVTGFPRWNPPGRSPQVNYNNRQWFRWTAAVDGSYALTKGGDGEIFTSPEEGRKLFLDPRSGTFQLQAGRTYWIRTNTLTSGAWFEVNPEPLTANGDPSTAIALSPDLPAAATAVCRGDQNSEFEVQQMKDDLREDDLRDDVPVIWWKWQPQTSQWVRAEVQNLHEWASEWMAIFTGDFPELRVRDEFARYDYRAHYFNAVAGRTYWFAVAAVNRSSSQRTSMRLGLEPVAEVTPPNDNFANSRKVDDYQWIDDWGSTVVHYGAPAAGTPLRWEWTKATMEPGEPPVHLIGDDKGNVIKQTATSWFNWTAPVEGIFQFTVRTRPDGPRSVRGGSDPFTPIDLTADLYTGGSLQDLIPVKTYEPVNGRYFFRAAKGQRYHIRAASGERMPFYEFLFMHISLEELYDFAAMEEERFADAGHGWESNAGDGIPNVYKFLFGLNPGLPVSHPENLLLSDRLPRLVSGPGGTLEMRCRPDARYLPQGNAATLVPAGRISSNLEIWESVIPEMLPNGEVAIRHPGNTPAGFLRWDVLPVLLDAD
jgi:hypothetical protein